MATATAPAQHRTAAPGYIKFNPSFESEAIALISTKGIPKPPTRFNGDQVLFTLTDQRRWYVDLIVAQKIEQMRIEAGEVFEVFKTETRRGSQRIVEVQIKYLNEEPAAAQLSDQEAAGNRETAVTTTTTTGRGAGAESPVNSNPSIPGPTAPATPPSAATAATPAPPPQTPKTSVKSQQRAHERKRGNVRRATGSLLPGCSRYSEFGCRICEGKRISDRSCVLRHPRVSSDHRHCGAAGQATMNITTNRMTCLKCAHVFEAELVMNAPVKVSIASMKAVRCPACGAGSDKVTLGGGYTDSPALDAPIAKRAEWWRKRGDVGTSSLTIWSVFTGSLSAVGYPNDPDDFRRCKLLLDLIPEWRQDMGKITDRFPWYAPFVDRWAEFEKLYAEESQGKKAPKLYALMQVARKEADAIREAGKS